MVSVVITFLITIQIWKTQIQDLQLGWDTYQMLNRVVQLFFFTLSLQCIQARFHWKFSKTINGFLEKNSGNFWKRFKVKGSAIFWNNLDRYGNLDPRTFHAACPVLQGNKWVTQTWFRNLENSQPTFWSAILFMKLKKEILNNQSNIIPTLSIIKSKPTIWPTVDCQSSKNVSINWNFF